MFDVTVAFPKMKVGAVIREGRLVELRYVPLSSKDIPPKSDLAAEVARQLESYREDPDAVFDLPIVVEGNELQKQVWRAMCAIPRGRTRTYGEIAREIGTDARAVGQACGDNRLPIVIPCHRVVAADGLGGFAHSTGGYLLEAKRWLLIHEAGEFALRP